MKTFKKLSLFGLLAISIAATPKTQAEELSIYFRQQINENFAALLNGKKNLYEVIVALQTAAQTETNPAVLEDIAFLEQNRKQILTCLGRIKQLYSKIENYLDNSLKDQINTLRLDQWLLILMR